jgi:hypothetical protein
MANNRLYIVDETSKYYICIAKEFRNWQVGNSDLLEMFLDDFSQNDLKIIDEKSIDFLHMPNDYTNYNTLNKWETYGK